MSLAALALALAFASLGGPAPLGEGRSAQIASEAEARTLIGMEYTSTFHGARFTETTACTDQAGESLALHGRLSREWASGEAWCGDRIVLLLKRLIGREGRNPVWRIVDAVQLPPFKRDWTSRDQHQVGMFIDGECRLDGRIDTSFVALARLGNRDRVDWRTGVKHAWTFDVKRERIVPVSTKRVVCERPTPP